MIVALQMQEGQRSKSLDNLRLGSRPGKPLKQFLENEASGHHDIWASQSLLLGIGLPAQGIPYRGAEPATTHSYLPKQSRARPLRFVIKRVVPFELTLKIEYTSLFTTGNEFLNRLGDYSLLCPLSAHFHSAVK